MTTEASQSLMEKIKSQEATIGVIGLGYVGLPLAIKLAEAGFFVRGIEKQPAAVTALVRGKSFVPEVEDAEIGRQLNKNFRVFQIEWEYQTTIRPIREQVANCDVYILCVPTPLAGSSCCEPDADYLRKAAEIVTHSIEMSPGKERLVILESTTYPGCTEEVILRRLQSIVSTKVNLAYSPERTNPGKGWPFWKIRKVVGGLDDNSFELAKQLYAPIFEDQVWRASSMVVAETIKCAENAYRFVSISFANKLAQLLACSEVDVWRIIEKMNEERVALHRFFPTDILEKQWSSDTGFFDEVLKVNGLPTDTLSSGELSIDVLARKCVAELNSKRSATSDPGQLAEVVTPWFAKLTVTLFHQLATFCSLESIGIDVRNSSRASAPNPSG